MADAPRLPNDPHDKNMARARALKNALNGALQGFGEAVTQRDIAELAGDLRRKGILARQVKEILARLDDEKTKEAFAKPLTEAYSEGFKRGDSGGAEFSLDRDRIAALADGFVKDAQQGLANTKSILPYIDSKILDPDERDKLREAAIQATAEGLTTKEFAKRLQAPGMPVAARSFTEDGRLWVTVTGQRRFPADLYAETLARTTTYHAANRGTLDRAEAAGIDLVTSEASPFAIDFCLDLGGKVFALTDDAAEEWGVPLLSLTPNGGPPYHPNCRCVITPFVPSDSDKGDLPTAPDDVLTREDGRDARRNAEAAFQARLEKDPEAYAEEIGSAAAVRGFGNTTAPVPEELQGAKIPGLAVGAAKETFKERGFAEDVSLARLLDSGDVKSRKQLRQVAAETIRNGKVSRDGDELVFQDGKWTVRVKAKTGLVTEVVSR